MGIGRSPLARARRVDLREIPGGACRHPSAGALWPPGQGPFGSFRPRASCL